jgi:hypothetical protein
MKPANFTRFSDNQITDAGNTVDFGIPVLEVQGYTFGRLYAGAIQGSATPGILAQNTYEARDTVIQTIGAHTIRYGALIRWEQDNDNLSGQSRPDFLAPILFGTQNATVENSLFGLSPAADAGRVIDFFVRVDF